MSAVTSKGRQELLAALVGHEIDTSAQGISHYVLNQLRREKLSSMLFFWLEGEGPRRGIRHVQRWNLKPVYKPKGPRCRIIFAIVLRVPLFW